MGMLDPSALTLPQRYLEMLLALLRQHIPAAEVWAYGSRVSGDCHDASDLDLVVRTAPTDEPVAGLEELREALVESNLPIRVDVVDWSRVPESFRREIEREYVVVQTGGARG